MEPLTHERRRLQTRQHLLAAAAEVFTRRGFHEATLEQVAAAAGFTKGAVYSNFASKEDLFLALSEEHINETLGRVRSMLGSSEVPPGDRLEDFVQVAVDSFELEKESIALYLEFWLYALRHPEARQRLAAIDRVQVSAIESMIDEERRRRGSEGPEDTATVARLVVALFHGIGILGLIDPASVDPEFMGAAVRLVDRGLAADRP
jgi:AcrR family transcriptional regulator